MIRFTSTLSASMQSELDAIIFYNPALMYKGDAQKKIIPGVIRSLDQYGEPQVKIQNDRLRIVVETFPETQNLFALDCEDGRERLAAVVMYVREPADNILVLHIAVDEAFSTRGKEADALLVMRAMIELRKAARRIKGVKTITINYAAGATAKLAV